MNKITREIINAKVMDIFDYETEKMLGNVYELVKDLYSKEGLGELEQNDFPYYHDRFKEKCMREED